MAMIVYTVIYNDYDTLKEPTVVDPNCRYICFSNTPQESDVWEWRFKNMLSVRDQRILKIMAPQWEFMGEEVLYIDGSIQIVCNPSEFCKELDTLTVLEHRETNCVYQEAEWMLIRERDSFETIMEYVGILRDFKEEPRSGIAKTGWMYINTCDYHPNFKDWAEDVQRYSIRDQLSFHFNMKSFYDILPYDKFRVGFKLKDHTKNLTKF